MSKRKDRWAVIGLPGLVRVQAREQNLRFEKLLAHPAEVESVMQQKLYARHRPTTEQQAAEALVESFKQAKSIMSGQQQKASAMRRASKHLEMSALYWVTAPMAKVAMDASLDVPEIDAQRDMPSPTGFVAFEKDLPALPAWNTLVESKAPSSLPASVPVSALFWYPVDDQIRVVAYARSASLPPLIKNDTRDRGPLAEIVSFDVPRGSVMSFAEAEHADPRILAMLAFLSATWVLMMTPTVAQRKTIDPRTGGAPRPGVTPAVPLVTTIDLRPLRHEVKTEESDESGRVYRHRWIVRGHWRNQAHGPARSLRRMTWVPSYIKGPEGAPLLATEKVMVWRR